MLRHLLVFVSTFLIVITMESMKDIVDFFEESDVEGIRTILNEYFVDEERTNLDDTAVDDNQDDPTNSVSLESPFHLFFSLNFFN